MFCLYILNDTLLSHVWTSALCVLTHKFCGLTTKLLYFVDFIILLVIRLTNKFSDRIFCTWVECERLYASTFIKSRPFNTRFNHKRKKRTKYSRIQWPISQIHWHTDCYDFVSDIFKISLLFAYTFAHTDKTKNLITHTHI